MLALAAALPPWLLAFTWTLADPSPLRWSLVALAAVLAVAAACAVRSRFVLPLRSMANLLEALRGGDYSMRGRHADGDDAYGEVLVEINALSRTLHEQRLESLEAGMLLSKVVAEIDQAVFAFDDARSLRLVNRAGARLLREDPSRLHGCTALELGVAKLLQQPSGTIVPHTFPGSSGRWEIRHRSFRDNGRSHKLLVISDLSRALRDEERRAWRRLVRVLGHELNNSLTPIGSMAESLRTLLAREPLPSDWRGDAGSALGTIVERARSLSRFLSAYADLTRLPPPHLQTVSFRALVERAVSLEGNDRVEVRGGPDARLSADPDQLAQVLINLLKNACEATAAGGGVRVRWRQVTGFLEVEIEDDGTGLADSDNLWTPFFTTKPGGSGIGLVLCRDIVENHGGRIEVSNRRTASGCVARLHLPCG